MYTRQEILNTLNQQQERMISRFRSFTPEELERPCTESEVADGSAWRPKDHLAHMTMIERTFLDTIRRALEGNSDPLGLHRFGQVNHEGLVNWLYQKGSTKNVEQGNDGLTAFQNSLHHTNQDYVEAHRNDDLDTLIAAFNSTRANTVAFINERSDQDLATPIPGSPWADGTVGGLLITNAGHDILHMSWVKKGLQKSQPGAAD